jgi:lipopolysaccharide/colanic/teichoic acid biosynthesis glycosyltransferase
VGYPVFKRIFDLVCAGFGMLVLLPVGGLLGLLVKLSDGGPVFYAQTRVGRSGKPFRIWKFRSMVVNADKLGVPITKDEDPRITWIGRLLRKSKLDELPQLWNVLVGDMSLVGPRPEVARYVDRYTPGQREILNYKPGITDVATLLFRNEEALLRGTNDVEGFYLRYCLPKKIELNLEYERRATLVRDLWIILQTLCPYWVGVLVIYAAALAASFWFSYELHSDFKVTGREYEQFIRWLPWVVFPQLLFLFWRGQVRGLLSYFSVPELRQTANALVLALLLQMGLFVFAQGPPAPSRGIILLDFLLSFFALCGLRMGFRSLRERSLGQKAKPQQREWRVAIIGTGELATNLALDFRKSEKPARRVVAFFDDNPHTWNKRPHDIPVVGMPECLLNPEWHKKIDEIIVTLPAGEAVRLRELAALFKDVPLNVTFASSWPLLKPLNPKHTAAEAQSLDPQSTATGPQGTASDFGLKA